MQHDANKATKRGKFDGFYCPNMYQVVEIIDNFHVKIKYKDESKVVVSKAKIKKCGNINKIIL